MGLSPINFLQNWSQLINHRNRYSHIISHIISIKVTHAQKYLQIFKIFWCQDHLRTMSTFLGSNYIPFADTMWPRYWISLANKTHFLSFTNNKCYLNSSNIECKCYLCSLRVLLYMSMSSRKTTTNFPQYGHTIVSISVINDVGVLVKPNGITKNS